MQAAFEHKITYPPGPATFEQIIMPIFNFLL